MSPGHLSSLKELDVIHFENVKNSLNENGSFISLQLIISFEKCWSKLLFHVSTYLTQVRFANNKNLTLTRFLKIHDRV